MDKIKEWKYSEYGTNYTAELFEDRLLITNTVNGKDYKNEVSFKNLLSRNYRILSAQIDYEIFKEIVNLPVFEDLTELETKKRTFWQAFDNSDITEKRIFIDDRTFLFKGKFGFHEGYLRHDGTEVMQYRQSFENFFFYGPYLHSLPLDERISLRDELYKMLTISKHDLTLDDAYPIFDYDKIKPVEFEHIDGIKGIYFKITGGKVTVGGWDNPRDGGENYTSAEYLWYNMASRIPKEFHDRTEYVRQILEAAITDELPSEKLNPFRPGKDKTDEFPPTEGR